MGPGEDQPRPKQSAADRKATDAAYFKKWYERRKEQQPRKYRGAPTSVFDLAHHI